VHFQLNECDTFVISAENGDYILQTGAGTHDLIDFKSLSE